MSPSLANNPLPDFPDFKIEYTLWSSGTSRVAGIDEAGRGALAGPVSAAVVIFPPDLHLEQALRGVRDSKQMSLSQRENWAPVIRAAACAWAVGFSSSLEIDQLGILPATRLAIRRALEQLQLAPQHLLLDYIRLPEIPLPQTALVKGDRRSLSIAAASVLAKTSRDQVLTNMEEEIPGYAFSRHKGYGTALHIQALEERGPTSQHSATFAPVRCAAEIIRSKEQEKW